jgi:hypothetical protein
MYGKAKAKGAKATVKAAKPPKGKSVMVKMSKPSQSKKKSC